jgi:hypothetical protein
VRHRLASFTVIAYPISWVCWLPLLADRQEWVSWSASQRCGEENGWRGLAQPTLQRKHSALGAAVIVGGIWAAWHLPLFGITYGGEFSIGGGAWIPIPDTVTVAGRSQPVTVKTARSRLVIR